MRSLLRRLMLALVTLGAIGAAHAQEDFSKVEIKTEKLADGIYMMIGAGGNLGLVTTRCS